MKQEEFGFVVEVDGNLAKVKRSDTEIVKTVGPAREIMPFS
ncbi:hypothetical protein [Acetobacterium paludosum]|nr:hypothetical protein [Acetobacterium paludosum]